MVFFWSHYFFASNTAHVSAMYAAFLGVSLTVGTPPMLAALTLAFFLQGYTGLTITIFSIITLFFVMQLTAHVDWAVQLGHHPESGSAATPPTPPAPSPTTPTVAGIFESTTQVF